MVELVTGHANKAHATAEQAAGLNAGILGLDDYVLDVHDKFKITVVSANKVTIGTGELVMQGRHVSQGTPEDLIVTNGSQGQKRNDLIVCRYTKGSQSIESAKLVVVRGTPATGTPTDPAVNTTSPLDGGTTYDMPLYRIPLDGIAIGTPVALFNVLKPMSDVWDSLSPSTYTACGRTNEGVSALGAVSFKFPTGRPSWAAGRKPDSFVFSDDEQVNNNEIVQKRYMSRLWSLDANGGQFRILRSDTWSWINAGNYPVSWIATWNK